MNTKSILLLIDGQDHSFHAANVAWQMAQSANIEVTALHVIDTNSIWNFLAYAKTGFIGSGPYFAAHESIAQELRNLADTLFMAYNSRVADFNIKSTTKIIEGNLIDAVSREALNHDLVIIGHKGNQENFINEERRRFERNSACEQLIHVCPVPILIIQKEIKEISTLKMMVSMAAFNEKIAQNVLALTKLLGLKAEICLVKRDSSIEDDKVILEQLKDKIPHAKFIIITEGEMTRCSNDSDQFILQPENICVMSIKSDKNVTKTSLGHDAQKLVHFLKYPALLLYPELNTSH